MKPANFRATLTSAALTALAAGPIPWMDGRTLATAPTVAIGVASFVSATVATTSVVAATTLSQRVWAGVAVVSLGAFFGPSFVATVTPRGMARTTEKLLAWIRIPALVLFGIGLARTLGAFAAVVSLPIGIEAAVTMGLVGLRLPPLREAAMWLLHPAQIGLATGFAVASVVTGTIGALIMYASALVASVGAFLACSLTLKWSAESDRREARALAEQRKIDAKYFSGWLHDRVSNPVRLLRMQVAEGNLQFDTLGTELDRLEAMLREGQVDHLVESGIARLSDVAQPFLRIAERHGVEIVDVPDAAIGDLALTTEQARLASRTIGILINNAVQAGASSISLRGSHDSTFLRLEVEDDAGGFKHAAKHFGRSLTDLREVLDGRLEFTPTPHGSIATARMSIQ